MSEQKRRPYSQTWTVGSSGLNKKDWLRVTKRRPCPVCGKFKWCLIARNGSAVICPRTSEGATRDLGQSGFLHRGNFFKEASL